MARKRGAAKVVLKKKLPAKPAKADKTSVPVKKRGRPARSPAAEKAGGTSKGISIADIVKDKNVSTCEECGGVWFSEALFQKHLLICQKPNSSQAPVQDINAEIIAIKSKVPDLSITIGKRKKKGDAEKTANNGAKAGLQSLMSNKVQSLLASKSQESEIEEIDRDLEPGEVSISASNLRKNIASSMMKGKVDVRPTRGNLSPSKPSAVGGNKVVASVEVHSFNSEKSKENGSVLRRGVSKTNNSLKSARTRRSDAAFDALTTLSSEVEEQMVDDPGSRGRGQKPPAKGNKFSKEVITVDDAGSDVEEIESDEDRPTGGDRGNRNKVTGKTPSSPRGRKALGKRNGAVENSPSKAAEDAPSPRKKKGRKGKDAESSAVSAKEKQKSNAETSAVVPDEPEVLNPLEAAVKEEDSETKFDSDGVAFTCAVCQKNFSRKYQLDRHLKISKCSGLPLPSFPCELCNRVYTRKDNLREHLRSHTGEVHRRKNHKCPYCDKAFHGQSLLAIHIRKHTGEKPFACDFCPKRFPSTGALSKHRMTHTGEKPYSCNECGRRFTLKGTLSRHLRTHTGIRPHTCTFCGKKFIQIGGLNAHMFYHTGENGFKCDDCGKVFNRKARLQMHQLYVHIKLKPFVCDHCSKQFTRKEDLMRHAVLHTGEKPYKCPTCDRGFSVKPSLKIHLLTHTKEEPRSCHECGRAFIRKDCLLRHMRKRHRDVFDKLLFDEKDKKDASIVNTRVLSEKDLTENIRELLYLLIDEPTLVGFGWPDKAVDEVLELVIQRCGHTPVSRDQYSYMDRLRENAKLLFTVVIDDNAVKTLLNNQTVDEVILHVLRLAKT